MTPPVRGVGVRLIAAHEPGGWKSMAFAAWLSSICQELMAPASSNGR